MMSDLTKRLYKIAKDRAFKHHHVNMYAPGDKTTHRDFIEWEAADKIERLRAALKDNLKHVLLADAEIERLIVDQGQYEEEIERLRAELAEVQECERDLLERDIKADDEIERLRAALQDNLKHVLLADAENERLREQVVNLQTRNNALYEAIDILKRGGKLK